MHDAIYRVPVCHIVTFFGTYASFAFKILAVNLPDEGKTEGNLNAFYIYSIIFIVYVFGFLVLEVNLYMQ